MHEPLPPCSFTTISKGGFRISQESAIRFLAVNCHKCKEKNFDNSTFIRGLVPKVVLGLEAQDLGLCLEAPSPRKFPVLGSRTALFFHW